MIPPYDGPQHFWIGPLQLKLFGTLVVTGIFLGREVVLRLGAGRGVGAGEIRNAAAWALGAGFLGAHLVDVLFYHPWKIERDGLVALLKIWDGISSYGGFFGALVGLLFYFWRLGKSWWPHADSLMEGLVVGWVFGRLGCTLTSDHLGTLTDFPLAFAYAEGARHNLGFYELVFTVVVLLPVMWLLHARERASGYVPGIYVAVLSALYAPARFFMDFLRATDIPKPDPRFFGLTTAQYFSIALFALALWLLATQRGKRGQTLSREPASGGTTLPLLDRQNEKGV